MIPYRFPAGACARAGQRPDPSAKPASAGEARSDKTMRKAKGRVAQMVEHLTFNQVVPGSSPGALTNKFNSLKTSAGVPWR